MGTMDVNLKVYFITDELKTTKNNLFNLMEFLK